MKTYKINGLEYYRDEKTGKYIPVKPKPEYKDLLKPRLTVTKIQK